MKKKGVSWPSFLLGAVTAIICIGFLFVLSLFFSSLREPERPDSLAAMQKIREMQTIIRQKYLNDFDEKKQTDLMCLGLTAGLDDSYAAYYTKEEYESVRLSNKGYMQGIGVTIRQEEDGSLVIQTVIEDSPAAAAGVQAGDVLLKIDGTDLAGKTSADAAALIQGSEDQTVTIVVRRAKEAPKGEEESADSAEEEAASASETETAVPDRKDAAEETDNNYSEEEWEEIEIPITKGELEITSVSGGTLAELLDEDQQQELLAAAQAADVTSGTGTNVTSEPTIPLDKIGYISISRFNGTTSDQFGALYTQLQDADIQALVIDLRDNLGGIVEGCCDTLRQILPEGVIVYEHDRTGPERARECEGETPIAIPLVLLVNGNTASASEIFAGAVQDYGVGKIVGTSTYGKGVEQNSYRLSDGSVLKLTTTNYYTPDHHDINEVGILPDYEIEQESDAATDMQLAEAIWVLGMNS